MRCVSLKPGLRDYFDRHLESVIGGLPEAVRQLLDEVPLHVEDHPSRDVLARTGVTRGELLCGLYTGIPLTDRSVQHSGTLPDVVTIYRDGILRTAGDASGHVSDDALCRQIRITLLHELGHHHGLSEEDLAELGYG
jgi:predicted Zn-dependent protease with MMP-like domain